MKPPRISEVCQHLYFKEFTDEGGRTMGECETDLVTADIIINGKVLKRRELSVAYILEQTSAYSSNAT